MGKQVSLISSRFSSFISKCRLPVYIGRSCTLKEVGNFQVKGWAQVEMKQLRKISLKLEISNAFPYFALPITVIPFSKILRHVTSLIVGETFPPLPRGKIIKHSVKYISSVTTKSV